MMRWTKVAGNAVDYSLLNTDRQMLVLPTTRDEKFKAMRVIESFVARVGDTLIWLPVAEESKVPGGLICQVRE